MAKANATTAGLLAFPLLAVLLPGFAPQAGAADGENVRLYGTLVAEPCVLKPGDENIAIDFGKIVDKYLYTNGRTPSQPFQLHLLECDFSIGKQVSVSFRGDESQALSGLLAVKPVNAGIAIGIENAQGQKQEINKPGENLELKKDNNTLNFSTYVQGEPDAVSGKKISRGAFTSVATFLITYQ